MRIELHNLDGLGEVLCDVYDMPPGQHITMTDSGGLTYQHETQREYWPAVTDVPCPSLGCAGTIRWAEAGHVPGYRICDECGRHFIACGTAEAPTLIRVKEGDE